jgi:hypothetical protein
MVKSWPGREKIKAERWNLPVFSNTLAAHQEPAKFIIYHPGDSDLLLFSLVYEMGFMRNIMGQIPRLIP